MPGCHGSTRGCPPPAHTRSPESRTHVGVPYHTPLVERRGRSPVWAGRFHPRVVYSYAWMLDAEWIHRLPVKGVGLHRPARLDQALLDFILPVLTVAWGDVVARAWYTRLACRCRRRSTREIGGGRTRVSQPDAGYSVVLLWFEPGPLIRVVPRGSSRAYCPDAPQRWVHAHDVRVAAGCSAFSPYLPCRGVCVLIGRGGTAPRGVDVCRGDDTPSAAVKSRGVEAVPSGLDRVDER